MEHNGRTFELVGEPRQDKVGVVDQWSGTVVEVACELYDAVDMADAEPWLVWVLDGTPRAAVPASWYNRE